MTDIVERLRQRLILVPKPGSEPRTCVPNEWITMTVGGEHKAGDNAGEQYLPNLHGISATPARVQRMLWAVDPLCEDAAIEIERLRGSQSNESIALDQLVLPPILDACCGPRMMWFDSADRRALFIDKRQETWPMAGVNDPGRSPIVVAPDVVADFTDMPFPDESFYLVVFDPPHIKASRAGKRGRFKKIYGVLPHDWHELISAGFRECFRVLRPHGMLVFKWSEHCYPLNDVLALTPERPLFGHRTTRSTHWCVFMKSYGQPQEAPQK